MVIACLMFMNITLGLCGITIYVLLILPLMISDEYRETVETVSDAADCHVMCKII